MDAAGFAAEQFGAVDLGDQRRNRRLVTIAETIARHPGDTLPRKFGSPAELKAMYRLMNHEAVTHQAVLQPHRDRTREAMVASTEAVLILHDATELDYTGLLSLKAELGQIGNGSQRGYICHNSLALNARTGEVMGLIAQHLHHRVRRKKKEKRTSSRKRATRESRLWTTASVAIGDTPPGCHWIDVCDRGADLFEFLEGELTRGRDFVVRSTHNRRILTANGEEALLREHLRSLPSAGSRTVVVGRSSREVTLCVAMATVQLRCPQVPSGEHGKAPLSVCVIRTWEANPPEGVEPLEWFLLTPSCEDIAKACERVGYYERRWVIEEYHKCLKTGCGIERLQFTTQGSLQPTIGVLSVVSVLLLSLRDLGSRGEHADEPARKYFDAECVDVLCGLRKKDAKSAMTVKECLLALARLGGHQNRKGDGMPGWQTLWHGWMQLQAVLAALHTLQLKQSG